MMGHSPVEVFQGNLFITLFRFQHLFGFHPFFIVDRRLMV